MNKEQIHISDLALLTNSDMNKNDFTPSEFEDFDVIDMNIFKLIKDQTDGESAIVREIYMSYFSEAEVLMKLINEYADKENFEELRMSVHSLSGISATVGAVKIKEIAKCIEKELRNDNLKMALFLLQTLISSFQEFKKTINQMI